MRQIWTGPDFFHTLVFAPAEEYGSPGSTPTSPPSIASLCGQECDLFLTGRHKYIYYAGTYMVHSLRHVHPPGSIIPPDIVSSLVWLCPAGLQISFYRTRRRFGVQLPLSREIDLFRIARLKRSALGFSVRDLIWIYIRIFCRNGRRKSRRGSRARVMMQRNRERNLKRHSRKPRLNLSLSHDT